LTWQGVQGAARTRGPTKGKKKMPPGIKWCWRGFFKLRLVKPEWGKSAQKKKKMK